MGKKKKSKPKHGEWNTSRTSRYHKKWGWIPKKSWAAQVRADKVPQRSRLSRRKKSGRPISKTKKFGGKTYHSPSFHNDKRSAQHTAKRYRSKEGTPKSRPCARVVKTKNMLGDTKYVVYRRGGRAGVARRIAKRIRKRK